MFDSVCFAVYENGRWVLKNGVVVTPWRCELDDPV